MLEGWWQGELLYSWSSSHMCMSIQLAEYTQQWPNAYARYSITGPTDSLTSRLYMNAVYVCFICMRETGGGKEGRKDNDFRIFFLTNTYVKYSITAPTNSLTSRLYMYAVCFICMREADERE